MNIELDLYTKLTLLEKHTLMKINDILNTNFLLGQILTVDDFLRGETTWKDNLVDKCLILLDEYKTRKLEFIKNEIL